MDATCSEQRYRGNPSFHSLENPPQFFKIILKDQKLRFPPMFVRHYGKNLPRFVYLKDPKGLMWRVELVQSNNGEVWVHKGWGEFKDYYSVGHGHFVVFQYDGNSHFNVRIFDTTALEIDYSFNSSFRDHVQFKRANHVPGMQENTIDENKGKNVVVDEGNGNKRKGIKTETCSLTNDEAKTSRVKLEKPTSDLGSQCYPPKIKKECTHQSAGRRATLAERLPTIVDKETYMAYQRAKAFVSAKGSRNPICLFFMQPTYVSPPHYRLSMQLGFVRKCFEGIRSGSGKNVMLRVAEGKSWTVTCRLEKRKAKLTTGWKEFVMLNGLKLGDVCVFEASNTHNSIWDVTIFRN